MQRRGERAQHGLGGGLRGAQGLAEVELHDLREIVPELHEDRIVEAVLRRERLPHLRGGAEREVEVGGVAGEAGQEEDAEDHEQQRNGAGEDAVPEEGEHGSPQSAGRIAARCISSLVAESGSYVTFGASEMMPVMCASTASRTTSSF